PCQICGMPAGVSPERTCIAAVRQRADKVRQREVTPKTEPDVHFPPQPKHGGLQA
ncbi:hypothetical protein KUCAC02_022010, partial [Chaenocephalus aceratus]